MCSDSQKALLGGGIRKIIDPLQLSFATRQIQRRLQYWYNVASQ
jgi:hypothetical protein